MKERLRLKTVLEIKLNLENSIKELYSDIQKNNSTKLDTSKLIERLEKEEEQLIIMKEAIQNANRGRHLTGRTNNYYIYKYSNLQAKKRFYSKLQKLSSKSSQITDGEATDKVRKLGEELTNISSKLTKFNERKKVSVSLDKDLEAVSSAIKS